MTSRRQIGAPGRTEAPVYSYIAQVRCAVKIDSDGDVISLVRAGSCPIRGVRPSDEIVSLLFISTTVDDAGRRRFVC